MCLWATLYHFAQHPKCSSCVLPSIWKCSNLLKSLFPRFKLSFLSLLLYGSSRRYMPPLQICAFSRGQWRADGARCPLCDQQLDNIGLASPSPSRGVTSALQCINHRFFRYTPPLPVWSKIQNFCSIERARVCAMWPATGRYGRCVRTRNNQACAMSRYTAL